MTKPDMGSFRDVGPWGTGKGRVNLHNHGSYATGDYMGPEGLVIIYTEEPSNRFGSYNEFGYLSMEYWDKGKIYRRSWLREYHRSYLARLARQFIREVQQA